MTRIERGQRKRRMSGGQEDVPREDIGTYMKAWRVEAGLAARLNYPYCRVPYTNDHYIHLYTEPTVVTVRRVHLGLLVVAIY